MKGVEQNSISKLIDREEEVRRLKESYMSAHSGEGTTVMIAGEAGIGKTSLVDVFLQDILEDNKDEDITTIRAECLPDDMEPFNPVRKGLMRAELGHLISEKPPPKVLSTYIIDESGILIAKSERERSELDADIFASMLSAVENFVKDSLDMMDEKSGEGLNSIGYDRFNILLQTSENISIAVVIDGSANEFLLEDMKRVLDKTKERAKNWGGDMRNTGSIESEISWFIDSGKYDGDYLVDEPEIRKENLYDNILMGLQRSSKEKKVIFFLDNLQWADHSSLSLFHYLSRNIQSDNILLVGAYRPEDIISREGMGTHPLSKTLQHMNRENLYDEISLERLDEEHIEELIGKLIDIDRLSRKFIDKIYNNSEGNPFYVIESMKLLMSKVDFEREETTYQTEGMEGMDLPSKVEDIVLDRLNVLSEEGVNVLEAASVVGNRFTSNVLTEILDMNKLSLLRKLNEVEKRYRLVHSKGSIYRFDHNMVRETLYQRMSEELRKEYHQVIAETYVDHHKDNIEDVVEKIAHHYLMCGDERAGGYLLDAAEKSKERYANEEARRFYNNALEFLTDEDDLLSVYEGVGDVLSLSGKYKEGIFNYDKAIDLCEDKIKKAGLYRKISSNHENIGEYEKALDECSKGLDLVEEESSVEFIKLLNTKGWIEMRRGNYEEADGEFQEAYEIIKSGDHGEHEGMVMHSMGTVRYLRGDYDEAIDYLEKAIERHEEYENFDNLGSSFNNLGLVFWRKGDTDDSLKSHERSLEIRKKIGDERGIAMTFDNIGNVYHEMGDIEKALEYHIKGMKRRKKIGDERGLSISLNNVGGVYQEMGDIEKAIEYHEESLDIKERLGDEQGIASSYNNMGEAFHWKGDLTKAKEHHKKALELRMELGNAHGIASSLNNLGEVMLDKNDISQAQRYFNKAFVKSVDIGDIYNEIISLNDLGKLQILTGDIDKAENYLSKSRGLSSDNSYRRLQPCTNRRMARLYMEKAEYEKAQECTSSALEISREIKSESEEIACLRLMGEILMRESRCGEATKYLKEGMETSIRVGEVIEESKIKFLLGLAYKEMGEKEAAMEHIKEAITMFKKIGMPHWVERCEKVIQ